MKSWVFGQKQWPIQRHRPTLSCRPSHRSILLSFSIPFARQRRGSTDDISWVMNVMGWMIPVRWYFWPLALLFARPRLILRLVSIISQNSVEATLSLKATNSLFYVWHIIIISQQRFKGICVSSRIWTYRQRRNVYILNAVKSTNNRKCREGTRRNFSSNFSRMPISPNLINDIFVIYYSKRFNATRSSQKIAFQSLAIASPLYLCEVNNITYNISTEIYNKLHPMAPSLPRDVKEIWTFHSACDVFEFLEHLLYFTFWPIDFSCKSHFCL